MKTNKLLLSMAGLMAMAVFTACSSDEVEPQQLGQQADVINLTSAVAQTRATSELQTSALNTATKVGVFGISGTTAVTNGTNNQYSVGSDGSLTAVDNKDMKWPSDASATVDLYAYAPYQSSWADYDKANSFSVAADQSADAGYLASDLLYAHTSVNKTNGSVVLNFSHQLARINVKLIKGDVSDYDLSSSTVSICGTKVATTLNPKTGALGEASGSATDIKIASDLDITTDGTMSYGVIVPQSLAAETPFVKIVADGKILSAKLGSAVDFEAGKAYNFTATIGSTGVALSLGSVSLTGWEDPVDITPGDIEEVEPEPITLTATFGTPGSNASYSAPTYTWTGSTSNLMTVFEFANGELAKYHTLKFTFSNLVDGPVRMGYYVGNTFTEFGSGYYSAGEKTVDLTALGIDLSTVTKIVFGGRSNAGSCDIVATDIILIGNPEGVDDGSGSGDSGSGDSGSGSGDDGSGDGDGSMLTATFGTPGGNASYAAPTYTWTATNNNLMTVFEFASGELKNYTKLTFTISNLTSGTMVRMGYYVGETFTEFGSGYGSNGTKEVDLTALGIDLSTVTKIAFGGRTGTGSVEIKASEVILSK